MRLVYFAYPIDAVPDDQQAQLATEITDIRNRLMNMDNVSIYEPGKAWKVFGCTPDARVQAVNNAALDSADLVFSVLHDHYPTVGVPMEVQRASMLGIPSFIVRGKPSWALQQRNMYQFRDADAALAALGTDLRVWRKPKAAPTAKFKVGKPGATPTRAYPDDAGFDLYYTGDVTLNIAPNAVVSVPADVCVQWPAGVWGFLVGRSSTFGSRGLLVNPGIIDPGFRGELFAITRNISHHWAAIEPGERIAQIIPLPALAPRFGVEVVEELDPSERGLKGFGSSGL